MVYVTNKIDKLLKNNNKIYVIYDSLENASELQNIKY